jgi:cyanophycinase-like exopeptidase
MNGRVYLQGSGQPSAPAFKQMIEQALGGVTGRKPRVALTLAALDGNASIIKKFLGWFTARAFGGAEVTRIDELSAEAAKAAVESADLIYLSGGDPVAGARNLAASGRDVWLREARARGAALGGGSAGAILLGAFWADWPEEPDGKPFDGGTLVRMTGVVGDLVVDTHNEEDDWDELRLVHGMLQAAGENVRLRGIPTGGGLIVAPDGAIQAIGDPPLVL